MKHTRRVLAGSLVLCLLADLTQAQAVRPFMPPRSCETLFAQQAFAEPMLQVLKVFPSARSVKVFAIKAAPVLTLAWMALLNAQTAGAATFHATADLSRATVEFGSYKENHDNIMSWAAVKILEAKRTLPHLPGKRYSQQQIQDTITHNIEYHGGVFHPNDSFSVINVDAETIGRLHDLRRDLAEASSSIGHQLSIAPTDPSPWPTVPVRNHLPDVPFFDWVASHPIEAFVVAAVSLALIALTIWAVRRFILVLKEKKWQPRKSWRALRARWTPILQSSLIKLKMLHPLERMQALVRQGTFRNEWIRPYPDVWRYLVLAPALWVGLYVGREAPRIAFYAHRMVTEWVWRSYPIPPPGKAILVEANPNLWPILQTAIIQTLSRFDNSFHLFPGSVTLFILGSILTTAFIFTLVTGGVLAVLYFRRPVLPPLMTPSIPHGPEQLSALGRYLSGANVRTQNPPMSPAMQTAA